MRRVQSNAESDSEVSNGSISLKNPQVKASSGGKGAQVETPAQPERASEHRETVKERAHERREAAREKAQEVTTVRGREMTRGDIFKFGGLIAFFALMVIAVILIWPYIHEAFEPGGLSRVIDDVRNAGPLGFLILLAMQFMQIVVAFIPGEVVQMAAGMMYGPWLGAADASSRARLCSQWFIVWARRSCGIWFPRNTSTNSTLSRKAANCPSWCSSCS